MANVTISAYKDKHFQQIKMSLDPGNPEHEAFLELFEQFSPLQIFEFFESHISFLLAKQTNDVEGVYVSLKEIASTMLSLHLILIGHPRGTESIPGLLGSCSMSYSHIDLLKDLEFFGSHWLTEEIGDTVVGEPIQIYLALKRLFMRLYGATNAWNFKKYVNEAVS